MEVRAQRTDGRMDFRNGARFKVRKRAVKCTQTRTNRRMCTLIYRMIYGVGGGETTGRWSI